MVAVFKQWETPFSSHADDWIHMISRGDAEAMWEKLFHIVSRHSAVRALYASRELSRDSLKEMYCDLTQDLYVKLHEKDRWRFYVDVGYTSERVEHELYGIEVPNLVSRLLRERYPESYRIARRTSNLLMTQKEFRCYSRRPASGASGVGGVTGKMVLQVFGLAEWEPDKPVTAQQQWHEKLKEVPCRLRDTRRAGRGSSSQVVISNAELCQLIIDIFRTINSPMDVRTMRSLVLSKLAIEDSRTISMDETLTTSRLTSSAAPEPVRLDFADDKPTPEEVFLEKETASRMEALARAVLDRCREAVRHKPKRFRKLIEVVWHCYFNPASPSQTSIAKRLAMSDSLVSHYRKIFDAIIRNEALGVDECVYLNSALDREVTEALKRVQAADAARRHASPTGAAAEPTVVKYRVATVSRIH